MPISRRDLIKFSILTAGALTATANAKNFTHATSKKVVIVGGGWSGLSVAKNLKAFSPDTEVVLVEQREKFISCPMSNLWLVNKVSFEYLTHDYNKAANNNNYKFLHATAIDVDKQKNILHTTKGDISYDYIVFAPGIDYDYSSITTDSELEKALRSKYPAGFKPHEHKILKKKIENFQGGNFIMTVPAGNYRCLPAPYERACLIANYFKNKNLKAKVLLLDENNDITIKEHGFHTAFKELYSEYIEYHPNSKIDHIDLEERYVETEFGEFTFEDASFYPRVRGAKILETIGIAKDTVFNKLEANIDGLTYKVKGEKNIYACGDVRPMGFSKSGNTASTEGIFVAQVIADRIANKPETPWSSPTTLCFSAVSIDPERAIFVNSMYAYNNENKRFGFATPKSSEVWKGKEGLTNAKAQYDWADALFKYMFES